MDVRFAAIAILLITITREVQCTNRSCALTVEPDVGIMTVRPRAAVSLLCDASCLGPLSRDQLQWRNPSGQRIPKIGAPSVFTVNYNRGMLSRLVLTDATVGDSGVYTCEVRHEGRHLQYATVLHVEDNTRIDPGPRRGDIYIEPEPDFSNIRPVRSVRYDLDIRFPDKWNGLHFPKDGAPGSEGPNHADWSRDVQPRRRKRRQAQSMTTPQDSGSVSTAGDILTTTAMIDSTKTTRDPAGVLSGGVTVPGPTSDQTSHTTTPNFPTTLNDNQVNPSKSTMTEGMSTTTEATSTATETTYTTTETMPTTTETTSTKTTTMMKAFTPATLPTTTATPKGGTVRTTTPAPGSQTTRRPENKRPKTARSGEADVDPDFGRFGMLAFALALSAAFLLLIALLLFLLCPRFFGGRRRKHIINTHDARQPTPASRADAGGDGAFQMGVLPPSHKPLAPMASATGLNGEYHTSIDLDIPGDKQGGQGQASGEAEEEAAAKKSAEEEEQEKKPDSFVSTFMIGRLSSNKQSEADKPDDTEVAEGDVFAPSSSDAGAGAAKPKDSEKGDDSDTSTESDVDGEGKEEEGIPAKDDEAGSNKEAGHVQVASDVPLGDSEAATSPTVGVDVSVRLETNLDDV